MLHLQPRSHETQRIWVVGDRPDVAHKTEATGLRLTVLPDDHVSFSSLRAILAQLKPLADVGHHDQLAKIDAYLQEACPEPTTDSKITHGQFLADSVTFAIMRRVSRESFYTARIIDLGARTINAILSQMPNCRRVYVDHIDRLDRPTLKVLTLAMLLLKPEDRFSWIWHSTSDPTAIATGMTTTTDLFVASRNQLLHQMIGILKPKVEFRGAVTPLAKPERQFKKATIYDISAALVLQNYDACFLWCDTLLNSSDKLEVAEGLRLMALAAVNIGKFEEALNALHCAEEMLPMKPGRRAHLAYLQGLIEAKRRYELSASTAHYERALASLDTAEADGREDLPLERGWLLNGLALNHAILWRRQSSEKEHYKKAFSLEKEAFGLVREGTDAARTYLRFNLLANIAFLLEMQGNYDAAIDLLNKAFVAGVDGTPTTQYHLRSTLGYRIGVLHYRAGRLDEAFRLLTDAVEQNAVIESWPTHERILRASGMIALDQEAFSEAATIFTKGLEISRDARSMEGTREHARGLITATLLAGKEQQAREINETLVLEEGLAVIPVEKLSLEHLREVRPSPPSPKLPAYIPEIDLEGIPAIDLNRFLGKALSQEAAVTPWGG